MRVEKLLPVDAKFPLDNVHRVLDAEDDEQRLLAQRALSRDVKVHVDAIATKYIRPGEGTYDFAFMYLPAESVYYEIACGGTGELQQYALAHRVFPVSPTTFHAYLTMIVFGLRGLQIERQAHEVMAYCGQLSKDFARFKTDFDVIGKHIGNAQGKYSESQRWLERFEDRLERATDEVDPATVGAGRATPRDRRRVIPSWLEPQDRADPFDGIEILPALKRQHLAAVREREADGQVEAVVARLHRRAVERAGRRVRRRTTAGRTAERGPLDARLEEQ